MGYIYTKNFKLPDELITGSKRSTYYFIPELNNKKVHSGRLRIELSSINLTPQEWFDKHALGITSSDERPKCPYCRKYRKFIAIYLGYSPTCGDKDCINKEYTRVQKESKINNEDRWIKQSSTIKKELKEINENWESIKLSSDISYKEFVSNSWKEWREKNERLPKWEYKEVRHKNKLERIKEKQKKSEMDSSISNNRSRYGGIRSKLFSKFDERVVGFDSLWERSFFLYISKLNNIKYIRRTGIKMIRYFNSDYGKERWYKPDFEIEYIDGRKELIEIKPYSQLNNIAVQEKKLAAEKWCKENGMEYRILTELELKEMGVIDSKGYPIYT